MNPVIGLDISKAESHGQAFLDRGKPHGGTFKFEHTREGLTKLLRAAQELEERSGHRPLVILEATGHYQSPVVQCLEEHRYLYIVINPLISNRLQKSNLRKVKTDAADAYLLGALYSKFRFDSWPIFPPHIRSYRPTKRYSHPKSGPCFPRDGVALKNG